MILPESRISTSAYSKVLACGGMASGARAFRHRKAKSSGSQEVSKTTSLGTNQGQG